MRLSSPDPYTPGQLPRILAGRRVELGWIRDRLGRVATFGELAGPLLAFHAPRGLGKTSLLRAAEQEAHGLGFASAWLACSRERPFLPELVRSVQRGLERVELSVDATRRWRDRLQRVSVQLGVLGVSVGGELEAGPRSVPASGAAPIGAVEDLLHGAATAVRERGGAGLVVFVDEVHAASTDDLATVLNALQNLDGDAADNPLTVVTAGLPVVPEAITRAATFGERSSFVPLDVLSSDDAASLLIDPAAALRVAWSPDAVARVVEHTGGHPYLLQLAGSSTWSAWSSRSDADEALIDLIDVDAGLPAAEQQLQGLYRARWGAATPLERAFVAAMADVASDNVTRASIAAGMGVASRSISVPRERLIEKGVIEPVGHGLVRFTLPGFATWVRDRADEHR